MVSTDSRAGSVKVKGLSVVIFGPDSFWNLSVSFQEVPSIFAQIKSLLLVTFSVSYFR